MLALDEQLHRLSEKLLPVTVAVLARALVQQLDALIDDRAADEFARPAGGGGPRPWRVREGVDVDETRALDDFQRALELVIVLTGEADDDVGGQRGAIEGFVD